ncbi:MAG: response regulator, partial [Pseudomonadota bacterium]|nr:response regulator [Pseudomonadota bacterium]
MNTETSVKGTLLIVDDIPDNVKVLLKFLIDEGFKVLVAREGEQGIQIAERAQPDLILLDIMMPGMDGFEVCQYLKSNPKTLKIPIIFMTALTDTVDKVKGFELGADDYITKPFQQEEVLARITTHLNLRKTQWQLQEQTQELEKRNMELDAFAHTVAHDLKNPVSGVMGIAEWMIECFTSDPQLKEWEDQLQLLLQASHQMLNIIDALLLLAGVSRQAQNIEIHTLDMGEIL